jgi:hypothetical protein
LSRPIYPGGVPGIVDGHSWRQARLRHLQAALETDPAPDEQARQAIEAEIAVLKSQTGFGSRLFRYWRVRRGGGTDL